MNYLIILLIICLMAMSFCLGALTQLKFTDSVLKLCKKILDSKNL